VGFLFGALSTGDDRRNSCVSLASAMLAQGAEQVWEAQELDGATRVRVCDAFFVLRAARVFYG
jgi:hypothetical protein